MGLTRELATEPGVARLLVTRKLTKPFRAAPGGGVKKTATAAMVEADVEGRKIVTNAMVINEIGHDEEGKKIDVLFGALAMQQWGIRLVPTEERRPQGQIDEGDPARQ